MDFTLIAIIVTVLVTILTAIYALFTGKLGPRIYSFFEKQGIKGPKPKFPLGNLNGAWNKDLGEEDLENVKKYGKVFGTFDGFTPNLIIADPDLIQKVLENDSDKFISYRAFGVGQSALHHSLLSIEGKRPKEVKEILNIAFGDGKIKKLFPRILKAAETFIHHLSKSASQDNTLNISEQVLGYINDTIAFSVFGLDLSADIIVREKFHKAVNRVFSVDNPDSLFSVTPIAFQALGSLDSFILRPAAAKYLTSLIDLVIEEKKKLSDVVPEARPVDFLDLLLSAAEEEKKNAAKDKEVQEDNLQTILTKDQMINTCLEVVLSVGKAAKSSLALSVHTLACHPNIQEKLNHGITEQLSDSEDIGYKFIQEFEYLDMFLGEIFRIYPIEYRLQRKCIEDIVWDDVKVSPGEIVSVPIYAVHRLPEFYPEPDKFQPERFNGENSKNRTHYSYLPFGQAGANSTNIGLQLGVLFSKLAILSLVNKFKINKIENTKEPPEFVKGIVGVPTPKPVWVKIEKRE